MYTDDIKASPTGWVVKNLSAMQETQKTWVQQLGLEGPLEEDMATHFSILSWRIPWIGESGGLQSMELQRVRHNGATNSLTVH